MKFHATVVFEFNAPDVSEARKRLNELLEQAQEHQLETRSLELSTPRSRQLHHHPAVALDGRRAHARGGTGSGRAWG
jgi:hypothetical protein